MTSTEQQPEATTTEQTTEASTEQPPIEATTVTLTSMWEDSTAAPKTDEASEQPKKEIKAGSSGGNTSRSRSPRKESRPLSKDRGSRHGSRSKSPVRRRSRSKSPVRRYSKSPVRRSRSKRRSRSRSRSRHRRKRSRSRNRSNSRDGDDEDLRYSDGGKKVFVGNLDHYTDEVDLEKVFSRYGRIDDIFVPRNQTERCNRGFAFVTFSDKRDAVDACAEDGMELHGRRIAVNLAKPRAGGDGRPPKCYLPSRDGEGGAMRAWLGTSGGRPRRRRSPRRRYRSYSRDRSYSRGGRYSRSRSRSRRRSRSPRRRTSYSRSR